MALLAAACLLLPRPHAAAVGQSISSPGDAPLALLAYGELQPALLPRAPADPSVRIILPQPPDGGAAAVAERAAVAARWVRGSQAPPPPRGSPLAASGFASSRLPTGPPTTA